jgi:hypothetical protein
LFYLTPKVFLSPKLGLGYGKGFSMSLFSSKPGKDFLNIPAEISVNIGQEKAFLECGIGVTTAINNNPNLHSYVVAYPIIGFRYQPLAKQINFRIFASLPILSNRDINEVFFVDNMIFSPLGISIGISF